jgi:hypothetical protein
VNVEPAGKVEALVLVTPCVLVLSGDVDATVAGGRQLSLKNSSDLGG